VKLYKLATSPRARHAANIANSALLMLIFPASLRGGLMSGAALHRIGISFWVSGMGGLMMLRAVGIPPMQRWLAKNFHFLTTTAGHTLFMLCAATMGLTTGPMGIVAGLATLANAWLAAHLRKLARRDGRSRSRRAPHLPAPLKSAQPREDEPVEVSGHGSERVPAADRLAAEEAARQSQRSAEQAAAEQAAAMHAAVERAAREQAAAETAAAVTQAAEAAAAAADADANRAAAEEAAAVADATQAAAEAAVAEEERVSWTDSKTASLPEEQDAGDEGTRAEETSTDASPSATAERDDLGHDEL